MYPGLYDLLDTPRLDFLAAQLHLHDSTLPRPLLHRSRGPPTIRSEYVALQPHLVPSPPPDRLYVCRTTSLSFNTSVCRATRPSVIPTAPTVCLSPRKSVALSVHPTDSPSVITARPSHEPSVHPPVTPSLPRPSAPPTCQSCATSVRPSGNVRPSVHHPTTSVRLSYVTPSARHTHQSVRPSATVPPSVRHTNQSVRPSATVPTSVRPPHPSVRPSNQYVSLSVTSQLSDRHYDSSAHTSVIPHDSPYPRLEPLPSSREWGARLEPLPSSREWGAITHNSPYTRLEPIPSSREWGAIPQGQDIP